MYVFSGDVVAGVGVTVTNDTDLSCKSPSKILLTAVEGNLVCCGLVCFMVVPALFNFHHILIFIFAFAGTFPPLG